MRINGVVCGGRIPKKSYNGYEQNPERPDAFSDLYHYHNKNFYSEPGYAAYNGYLILAADGSGLNIPAAEETLEIFGTSSRKNTKPQACTEPGCLYDVMNRMIIESGCSRCKFDEMTVVRSQTGRIYETIGTEQPFLAVMDRDILLLLLLSA